MDDKKEIWDVLKANEVIAKIAAIYDPLLRSSQTYTEYKEIKARRDTLVESELKKRFLP